MGSGQVFWNIWQLRNKKKQDLTAEYDLLKKITKYKKQKCKEQTEQANKSYTNRHDMNITTGNFRAYKHRGNKDKELIIRKKQELKAHDYKIKVNISTDKTIILNNHFFIYLK